MELVVTKIISPFSDMEKLMNCMCLSYSIKTILKYYIIIRAAAASDLHPPGITHTALSIED